MPLITAHMCYDGSLVIVSVRYDHPCTFPYYISWDRSHYNAIEPEHLSKRGVCPCGAYIHLIGQILPITIGEFRQMSDFRYA